MIKYIQSTIQEILDDKNPIVDFDDTYAIHEILEEKGFWETKKTKTKNYGLFNYGTERDVELKIVSKPFRFRVNHGNQYYTQNNYLVGQVVPEMIDIQPTLSPLKTNISYRQYT